MVKKISIYDVYDFSALNVYKVSMDLFSRNKKLFYPLIGIFLYFFLITIFDRILSSYFVPNGFLPVEYYLEPWYFIIFEIGTAVITLIFLSVLIEMIKKILYSTEETFSYLEIFKNSFKIFPKVLVSYTILFILLLFFSLTYDFLISEMFQNSDLNSILLFIGIIYSLVMFGLIFSAFILPLPIIFDQNNIFESVKNTLQFVKENYWSIFGVYLFGAFLLIFFSILFGFVGNLTADLLKLDLTLTFTYPYPYTDFRIYRIYILSTFLQILSLGVVYSLIIVGSAWAYYKQSKYINK
ncbi:MAG: hypothetical protein ACW981_16865 [Candidatus Hodarchaeales archaeon]